ncbi:MAG: hypothetical protein AAF447_19470 [Myxococcota bacterium]
MPFAPRALSVLSVLAALLMTAACGDDDGTGGSAPTDAGAPVDCDALLTPADFTAVCGAPVTLVPSAFEGIALNPCNRASADGAAVLLVTEHPNPSVAASAAEVAGGRVPTEDVGGLFNSAGAAGIYAVEVKAEPGTCDTAQLPMLLDLALGRL